MTTELCELTGHSLRRVLSLFEKPCDVVFVERRMGHEAFSHVCLIAHVIGLWAAQLYV
jgi:hypothetical protein